MSAFAKDITRRRRPPLILVAVGLALTYAQLALQSEALESYRSAAERETIASSAAYDVSSVADLGPLVKHARQWGHTRTLSAPDSGGAKSAPD